MKPQPRSWFFFASLSLMAWCTWHAGGCAKGGPTNSFEINIGEYECAFSAAKDALRDSRFILDRVDAEAGVLSTRPKTSMGLASPWDLEQSTVHDEAEDLLNQQRRTVRVTFEGEGGGPPSSDGTVTGSVWVTVLRTQTAGLRAPSKAAGLTTLAIDPMRTSGAVYEVPVRRDPALERRIAGDIKDRVKRRPGTADGSTR